MLPRLTAEVDPVAPQQIERDVGFVVDDRRLALEPHHQQAVGGQHVDQRVERQRLPEDSPQHRLRHPRHPPLQLARHRDRQHLHRDLAELRGERARAKPLRGATAALALGEQAVELVV